MRKLILILPILALAVLTVIPASSVADEEDKELARAKDAVLKLADSVKQGKKADIDKGVAELAKMDLEPIMHQFKIRRRGGIGFGEKPLRTSFKDGIEAKIRDLSRTALSARDLKKEKDDLIRMAQITIAIAKVTHKQAPTEKKGDMDPADWKEWSADMETFSEALIKAAEKQDASALRTAARELNNRCSGCHGTFR